MPVNTPDMTVTPYTSTVPLIQVPPSQVAQETQPAGPLPGQFGKKGTGGLAIGDAIFKGLMMGHEAKAQRKAEAAKTTIAAADAASEAAFSRYQESLATAGGNVNDPGAKAAYDAYTQVFNQGKAAKAQFVMPEEGAKKKTDGKKKGIPGMGGIKDFFEANPHIVPSIALMTMQPKSAQATPETARSIQQTEAAKFDMDTAKFGEEQKKLYAAGVPVYGSLTPEEIGTLPPDAKKGYDQWLAAKAYETPMEHRGALATYIDPQGNPVKAYPGEEPPGSKPYIPGLTAKPFKPGSYEEFAVGTQAQYGLKPGQPVPPQLDKYIHDYWAWKQGQQTSSTQTATVDAAGNRTAHNTVSRGTPAPKPPAGFQPIQDGTAPHGMAPPPTAGTFVTPAFKSKDVPGMVSRGNVNLATRPNIDNHDGTHSSVFSMSFGTDQGEVLVPGVGDGVTYPLRKLTSEEALDQYKKTGKNLGTFKDEKSANAYAETLHEDQAKGRTGGTPKTTPSSASRGIQPPPKHPTLTEVNRTQKVETEKLDRYTKAQSAYDAEVKAARTALDAGKIDQSEFANRQKQAYGELRQAHQGIEEWYNQQVHAAGGKVPGDNTPPGATIVYKDQAGNVKGWAVNGAFVAAGK